MIRNLILAALAVTASAMLPTSAFSQTGETSLRWQFPVGRKLEVELTQRIKNSQNKEEEEMSTTNFMTWEVESFDESTGVAVVNSEIHHMKMIMDSPNGEVKIDSNSDKESVGVAKVNREKLVAMVGKPFLQMMDARGEVLTVNFPEEFDQATLAMGRDAIVKVIKNVSPRFPKNPMAIGHSWTREVTTPMLGGIGLMHHLTSTYTYKGRETIENKELEVIDVDTTTIFKTPFGSQVSIEIVDQTTEGKIYFDAVNGYTTAVKVEQSLTLHITLGETKINQTIENITEGKFRLAN